MSSINIYNKAGQCRNTDYWDITTITLILTSKALFQALNLIKMS